MSTGIVSTSSRVFLAFLATSVVAIAGCDNRLEPPLALHATGVSLLDPSDNGRQRDDPARNRVWILNSRGVFLYNVNTGKLVEVSLPSWQWVDEQYACPPDLAIGPAGEAVITSNTVPVLWRIHPETLKVSVHELALDADNDKDIGFSALKYSSEHGVFLALSDVHGSLWRIDPLLKKAQKVPLPAPIREAGSCLNPQAHLARHGD